MAHTPRWIAGLATASLVTAAGVPLLAYEQDENELDELRQRLDALEQQQGQQRGESTSGLSWDTSEFKPGWERVRNPNWMEHGKLDEMSVRIGRAGPIDLYMGLNTAGRLQYLQQKHVEVGGVSERGALEPGFQTAWGSIDFLADLYDGALEVYFDLYLSSPTSADKLQGHEGYMIMREVPGLEDTLVGDIFNVVDVKAGHFEIDFGDHRYRRTDNARAQRNPLIGNPIVDPKSTEIGMEIFNAYESPLNWLVGFGSGDETGGFAPGRGLSVHAKTWADLSDELRISGSGYYLDHDPDAGASSNLFRTSRGTGIYDTVFNGSHGQIFIGSGTNVLAFQGDATWQADPVEIFGHFGWARDDDNAGEREEWLYYGLEGSYHFTPRLYAAARYSGAAAQRLGGSSSSGLAHRAQLGGGYWLYDTVLVKAEYVYQVYDGFSEGETVSRIDAWQDPSFNGLMMEVTFAF